MSPDDDAESRLWQAASLLLSAPELRAVVDGLNDPPLPIDMARSAYLMPLAQVPLALLPLLQPFVLQRELSRDWVADGVPPGIFLPEALIERLTQRLAVALLLQLQPWLVPVPPDLPARIQALVGDTEVDLDQPLPTEYTADDLERELFHLALATLGEEGLDAWLRAQRQRHEQWLSLPQGEIWLRLDPGPQIERLVALGLLPNLLGEGGYPTGEDQAVFRAGRQRLFDELLQHLPVDCLPPELREARLLLDLGV
ncbi:hypothetical protein [Pseudomonas sp. BF-R-01]|uniref:hypothetical protein n=1 Tax=Pseudomonas sp. BF-R-01 TaxID=2832365 RepID=UPI001CC03BA8|nr:hypothetical protein [Pseudomonas sp. BF-R-01]